MEKEKPRILLFLLIFYQRDHRNQSLPPGPHHLGWQGEHTSLWFFIFLRSHHLSNREFLCAEARLPSGGHLGEMQPGEAAGTVNRNPITTPAWLSEPQPWPGGPGLTLRCPREGRARASTPPLCQPGYGPQCIPVQSQPYSIKINFLISICVCVELSRESGPP